MKSGITILTTLIILLYFNALQAQQTANDTLAVGYVGSSPFIIEEGQQPPSGIVVDIWTEIASALDRQYTLQPVTSVQQGIDALQSGEFDLVVGPITINSSRAEQIVFSQPFYETDLALLSPIKARGVWDTVAPFFSKAFLIAVVGLLFVLSIVGVLFWLVEGRHHPEDYPRDPVKCIGTGIWIALVTMTTVGYGDYAPKTVGGRVVLGSWMVISLILATSFIAGIATTFSKVGQDETISRVNQLQNKTVTIPSNQETARLVKTAGGTPLAVDDVSEAYRMLLNGEVDAILYDDVPLKYIFETAQRKNYLLSENEIAPQRYGFMFPNESSLKHAVDQEIIRRRDSQEIKTTVDRWIATR